MADLRMSLRELSLQGVEDTGREIGKGAYGVVREVNVMGKSCAGKMLHGVFLDTRSEERQAIVHRFEQECLQLGRLRHPNIVLLIGVYFKDGEEIPILVMERLPMCLTQCLENYPSLPTAIQNSILLDVLEGLHYLHSQDPALIHRDITANNILLTNGMQAKIADLGVTRIVNIIPGQVGTPLTAVPGTICYMPPEAFIISAGKEAQYNDKLDIFSFGNLILHVVNQQWPFPMSEMLENSLQQLVAIPEIKRRAKHLDQMGEEHPLRALAIQCLDNDPERRPTAATAITYLREVISRNPPSFNNTLDILQAVSVKSEEIRRLESQVHEGRVKEGDLVEQQGEMSLHVESLVGRLAAEEEELKSMQGLLRMKEEEVVSKVKEMSLKDSALQGSRRNVEALEMELAELRKSRSRKAHLLDPLVYLTWTKCPKLPSSQPSSSQAKGFGRRHAQAVIIDGKVYVGGGFSDTDDLDHYLYSYNTNNSTWDPNSLPRSPTRWFAMAAYNGQLVLAGGKDARTGTSTDKIATYRDEQQTWDLDRIPAMGVARMGSAAIGYASHLVVAGGWDESGMRLDVVEVFSGERGVWSTTESLPRKIAEMKTAFIGHSGTWVLVGGSNQGRSVFATTLQTLIDRAARGGDLSTVDPIHRSSSCTHAPERRSEAKMEGEVEEEAEAEVKEEAAAVEVEAKEGEGEEGEEQGVWKRFADVPAEFSSVAIFGNCLVCLGGISGFPMWSFESALAVYIPHTQTWRKISEAPVKLSRACTLTLPSTGELLVVGGNIKGNPASDSVYKCTLSFDV